VYLIPFLPSFTLYRRTTVEREQHKFDNKEFLTQCDLIEQTYNYLVNYIVFFHWKLDLPK